MLQLYWLTEVNILNLGLVIISFIETLVHYRRQLRAQSLKHLKREYGKVALVIS